MTAVPYPVCGGPCPNENRDRTTPSRHDRGMTDPWGSRSNWRKGGVRRRSAGLGLLSAVVGVGIVGALALFLSGNPAARQLGFSPTRPWDHAQPTMIEPAMIRVIDGDTFRIAGGERVRILNIDAPELGNRASCAAEALLAQEARRYLTRRIQRARRVDLTRAGHDRFRRTLARVRIDGSDVGEDLVRNQLAQPWRGHRAEWCATPTEWDRP